MLRFEKLRIWTEAVKYGNKIYDIADSLPKNEVFGLSSQLKRAAVSISSNIAEGAGSTTVKDFRKFLDISVKSTLETVSQVLFAQQRGYIESNSSVETIREEAEVLVKRVRSFKRSLQK
ncbi:MAG: four helix bundle protein [Candidatus Blackburnbacteria bacterium]|nr:four helix bundle protein [Candidatus Blackburnbacteria bacterium]